MGACVGASVGASVITGAVVDPLAGAVVAIVVGAVVGSVELVEVSSSPMLPIRPNNTRMMIIGTRQPDFFFVRVFAVLLATISQPF